MAHIPAAERRRQITEVAARVIGREGVAKATTRRIGAEARANIGTLHYTFGSKDDLLDATFAYCWDLASEIIDDALEVGLDSQGTAFEMLTRYVELAIADPDVVAAQYQLLNWSLADESRKQQAVVLMQRLDDLIVDALGRATWPEGLSIDRVGMGRMIGSLLDGILLRFVVERSESRLRADLAAAMALVEKAFTAAVPASS